MGFPEREEHMTRIVLALAMVFGFTATARAGDDYGRKGTVTAYELDGRTVIAHKTCYSRGRYSYDYVGCGDRLRDSVKIRLCSRLGKGTHHYLYQIGDNRPTRSSVWCKRD
jgi:hypothetical protein